MSKKIVAINSCLNGSTGKIMLGINAAAEQEGYLSWTVTEYRRRKTRIKVDGINSITVGSFLSRYFHVFAGKLTGLQGCFSFFATIRLVKQLDSIKPDVIHLHNLHDSFINLFVLFAYVKRNNIPVVWTLHDCWTFTGRCPYFQLTSCDKWQTGCNSCEYSKSLYPKSLIDTTEFMWRKKRKWFTGVGNMTIITPSEWLTGLVRHSFLKEYPVRVINNGIDLSVSKPTESDFRKQFGIPEDKYIVLGVAFEWGERKGLDVFIELSRRLGNDYQIVLVGTDDTIDRMLPESIISIHRTANQQELAKIYSAADLFVNPTREDNYPTVNMEALACGTPVITFNTGGSPEMIDDTCGTVIAVDDVDALEREVIFRCEVQPFEEKACLKKAEGFAAEDHFEEYIKLYESLL